MIRRFGVCSNRRFLRLACNGVIGGAYNIGSTAFSTLIMAATYELKGAVHEVPKTAKRIEFDEFGPSSVLKYVDSPVPEPKEGEVLIKNYAIGVNFIDTYQRSGLYRAAKLPHSGLGTEAAGVVQKVGAGVTDFEPGSRVTYFGSSLGAYAEYHVAPAKTLVKIPDDIDYDIAAAAILKGLTVHYLIRQIVKLREGDVALFTAGAGGVGLIAMQWARHLGAKLIATASSQHKCELAKKFGAWETINTSEEDTVQRVAELTGGKKVPVVFDSVGKDTWHSSLKCLSRRGLLVSFGNASGPVTGANLGELAANGSLFVTRPTLHDYIDDLPSMSNELFTLIQEGAIKIEINQRFDLKDASVAHDELASRKTVGATILYPEEFSPRPF